MRGHGRFSAHRPRGGRVAGEIPSRSVQSMVRNIILLLWIATVSVPAAVRFDMFVGYDGLVPVGRWFPVSFEVQNDGPPFTATVEVSPGQFTSTQDRTMVVELPTGTTKRFVMPIFNAGSYSPTWSARVLDEQRKVRAETSSQRVRRVSDSQMPLAAAIARVNPGLPEFRIRQEESRPVIGRMQPALFPDNPISMDGLDVLYVSSERAMELKANQLTTLLAWLHGGGHLIVSIEQLNHLTGPGAWLKQVLPVEVSSLGGLSEHGELQRWVSSSKRYDGSVFPTRPNTPPAQAGKGYDSLAADSQFDSAPLQVAEGKLIDGRVLAGSATAPLVVNAARGRGQVTVLLFAPELEPFRSWKNAGHFWAKLIDVPPEAFSVEYLNQNGGRPSDAIFGAMVDSKQLRKLPVGWLLLLLIGYLVVIGPFDRWWLKKLNRQMLTWITFPAYVAFFSLLIYFIGYKLRAGETEWNELHVVDVLPHGERADIRGRSYGSMYSPVNDRYEFASEEPFATWRGEYLGNYGGGQDSSRSVVQQQSAGFRARASVPVWTSQLFVGDWMRQDAAPVLLTVTDKEFVIDNNLDVPLTQVRVVLGSRVFELPDVPAQEKKSFVRSMQSSTSIESFVSTHTRNFSGAVNARRQAFSTHGAEQGTINNPAAGSAAVAYLGLMEKANSYESFQTTRGLSLLDTMQRGDATLFAWLPNHSLTKPFNRFTASRGVKNTLLRVAGQAGK